MTSRLQTIVLVAGILVALALVGYAVYAHDRRWWEQYHRIVDRKMAEMAHARETRNTLLIEEARHCNAQGWLPVQITGALGPQIVCVKPLADGTATVMVVPVGGEGK